MKTMTRKTELVLGKDLKVGDVVVRGGYEWQIDKIAFEPDFPRYVCTCHWTGNGADPRFFNNEFETAQRDDLPWCRVMNPKPRRLACRTDAPAWYATQVGRKVELRQTGTDALLATIRPPTAWGDRWAWNTTEGGFYIECRHLVATTVTDEQAKALLPTMRAAVAALHEVWEKCREVERTLGRDLDGLEGIVQDMAAGVDDPESIDVAYVRDALNAQLDDEVVEGSQCPACGERRVDYLVWQKDEVHVKCTTCGKRYAPPAK